ncbi:neuronal PAS domain-containing protein 1 isoform X2 [Erinaceus europaeus]|uniref:Neuronal PAS domain-containing protein 1 isoform X2 n=1 Tax=Erinaceus europaeus TaxID=9365 RepID=A0ABM3W8R0_ERIEU|nr:neuronal PAS domain-containing protein 1 isoform X2 [Erinaceus europaeus]
MATPLPGASGEDHATRGGDHGGCSAPWGFLPGLAVKAPPGPCLQAQRKEKSRNAARSRRGKENLEFFELAKLLPLPGAISSQLDKASIVRLSVSYLRLRRFAALGAPPWGLRGAGPPASLSPSRCASVAQVSEVFEQHLGGHILQSLDGFVFALSQEGKFLYISETVSIYLGLSQVELTGSSVFDYIHPGDHSEVLEQLGLRTRVLGPPTPPSVPSSSSSSSSSSSLTDTPDIGHPCDWAPPGTRTGAGGLGPHAAPRPAGRAAPSRTRHRFPPQPGAHHPCLVSDHMDLGPSELVGRSCYQFIHGQDAARIRQSHLDLLDKGQVVTSYYRWLQRAGGFVWLQSVATVAVNGKSPAERHVLWVSYVLSQAESGHTPLDAFQLPASMAQDDTSSPEPAATEPQPPVPEKQAAPQDKDKAPQSRAKRIKVEAATQETKGAEDSEDEEEPPRPEFTSVIRAGGLKQDLVPPWGLGVPGAPSPSLLHPGFLPPMVRGLCTPGAIRYGPTELGLMYPHLQRLGPGPPLPDTFYPTLGLPFPASPGTRVQRKGD